MSFQVKPEILIWARTSAGLSPEDAASQLKIPVGRLRAWESGEEEPGLTVLRKMARRYRRPLAALLMPAPPPAGAQPNEFRTVGGRAARTGPETLLAIRDVDRWQDLVADLLTEQPDLVARQPLPQLSLLDSSEECAEIERSRIGVSVEAQFSWAHAREAFDEWRWRVQSLGVLVFQRRIPRGDCRGFSLWRDDSLPAIFVNATEVDQAKSFTLLHEYCHLALRQSGICHELEDASQEGATEAFCNRFAAAVLVPREGLQAVLGPLDRVDTRRWSMQELNAIARRFRVSRPATALRLEELRLAPRGFYDSVKVRLEGEEWGPPGGGRGRADPHVLALWQLGTEYSAIVVAALQQGLVDEAEAAEMLELKPRHLGDLKARIDQQRSKYAT